jgi:LysM repeat protein
MIAHMPLPAPGVHPATALARPASHHPASSITYTVQPGDCLFMVAQKFYHDGDYMRIFDANQGIISTPSLIIPGQQLVIPGPDHVPPGAAVAPAPISAPAPSSLPAPAQAPQPGVPWSIFNQPGGQAQAVGFARALLRALGAPTTPGKLQVIYDWQVSEGSGGWYNPLNGGDFGGLAVSGQQYGGGANNYPDLSTNVRAMAGILLNDPQYGYGAIVSALRGGSSSAARAAILDSEWAASHYGYGASFSDAPLPS